MFKKTLILLVALLTVFTAMLPVGASTVAVRNNIPHEYKVLPGSPEWKSLNIFEKRAATYVEQEEAERMTTPALLTTVLNYPFLVDMYALGVSPSGGFADNGIFAISNGIECVAELFPPLKELINRNDAVRAIDNWLELFDDADDLKRGCAVDIKQSILFLSNVSPAHLVDPGSGKPVDLLQTPRGSTVYGIRGMTWANHGTTHEYARMLSQWYADNLGVTMISPPNPEYNCHAYAWHSTSPSSVHWINDPSPYIRDGSYFSVSTPSIGMIITYQDSASGNYSHSGIITGSGGIVTSKWGCLGVFRHEIANCPYTATASTVRYWRRSR